MAQDTTQFAICGSPAGLAAGPHPGPPDPGHQLRTEYYEISYAERWLCKYAVRQKYVVRPRGLEPPLVAQLAPQASASTNSAMAAIASTSRAQMPMRRRVV